MSDIFRAERLPSGLGYRGDVKRGPAIHDRQPIGPWKGRVRITPLLGLRERAQFEVSVDWTGPPLLLYMHWEPGDPRVEAHDVWLAGDDLELARAVALMAEERLAAGSRFDLQQLGRERAERAR